MYACLTVLSYKNQLFFRGGVVIYYNYPHLFVIWTSFFFTKNECTSNNIVLWKQLFGGGGGGEGLF